jgi:hypothetical protein
VVIDIFFRDFNGDFVILAIISGSARSFTGI